MENRLRSGLIKELEALTPRDYQALLFMLGLPNSTELSELVEKLVGDRKLFTDFKSFASVLKLDNILQMLALLESEIVTDIGLEDEEEAFDETASPDPLGGLDPMTWLETLAARQGAEEGYTTSADLDIPEVDPDTVIDTSPGYTPSETIRKRHKDQKKEDIPLPPLPQAEPLPPPPTPIKPLEEAKPDFPPPQQAPGSSNRPSTVTGDLPALSPAEMAQPPHFAAFYPEQVQAGQAYALMAFVYLERFYEAAAMIANGYKGMMGDLIGSSTTPSTIQVQSGSLITFVPQIEGVRFNPTDAVVTWQPPLQHITFLFTTPATLSQDLKGRVLVYQGPLIIGEIPVVMKLQPAASSEAVTLKQGGTFKPYDPIFASYSHRDTPVMEYFRRNHASSGQKMLVDIYDLRAGEHWADRLLRMIDESAVFQLFWSEASAQSRYCRQEWEHALTLAPNRERFIQPVWWEAPMPMPPPELASLHFQRINLPAVTRLQLVTSRIRGLFGRR